ncbi:hypothetical protein K461DRAFT_292049 [Myriangium duriaei CBS 260.36]|uniref:Uncharacterized protein n=1 Tax=Myriangium duriaei CBS 260.36 TaxID=1168546 RepID=A0A9P4J5U2_9PEZI|nr:hypothetical protein K461DRAFT_292049 [Myriangium duriaei CBS 260.36]
MSRPKFQRHGRKLQISYESSTRINATRIYPVKSSNGSTVILSATDSGLRITWSGGKPLFFASQSEAALTNGTHDPVQAQHIAQDPDSEDEALYESDEEDLDDDHPYPSIVQDLDIALDSPALFLSVPPLELERRTPHTPDLIYGSIVVAVACESGTASLVSIPLDPPSASAKRKGKLGAHIVPLDTPSGFDLPRGLALTWTTHQASNTDNQRTRYETRQASDQNRPEFSLTIALATSEFSGHLHIFSLPISGTGLRQRVHAKAPVHPILSESLDALTTSVVFSTATSTQQSRLLLSDIHGVTSIYEIALLPTVASSSRNASSSVTASLHLKHRLSAPYMSAKDIPSLSQATHKKVLSAAWVFSGEAILVLLEDGQVGLYALSTDAPSGLRSPPTPFSFACETFIGDAPEQASTSTSRARKPHLAPMTPNTRRAKSTSLFADPAPSPTIPRGGISTFPCPTTTGIPDTAVLLWYNARLFSVPSLRSFWTQSDRSDAQGTLFSGRTAITALDDPDLGHEVLVDSALLPSTGQSHSIFGTAGPATRDVLVVAEYRSVILASIRSAPAAQLPIRDEGSPTRAVDKRLLERGELGLDGMDRMLEDMVGVERSGPTLFGGPGTARRVLFTEE